MLSYNLDIGKQEVFEYDTCIGNKTIELTAYFTNWNQIMAQPVSPFGNSFPYNLESSSSAKQECTKSS